MPSESTKQLLANYHDASKKLETRVAARHPTDESKELFRRLSSAARELVSRCILSDEPRSLIFLIEELETVLKIVGQPEASEHLETAIHYLVLHYLKYGTF